MRASTSTFFIAFYPTLLVVRVCFLYFRGFLGLFLVIRFWVLWFCLDSEVWAILYFLLI